MPSPSQDSDKLTDAQLLTMIRHALEDWGGACRFVSPRDDRRDEATRLRLAAHGLSETLKRCATAISQPERHRTPSVPGEDMRAKAATFLRDAGLLDPSSMHRYGLTERLATELSSTAALAREEAAKIADRWDLGNSETTTGGDLIARRIAAAIRAIGKEG